MSALLAVLSGCRATSERPHDVIVVGQVAEPKSLDPHAVTATNDFRILINLYEGLVRFKKGTLEIEPALATSWTVSRDGLTYTFHLRDSVTFHDGTPFDAEVVRFSFERMLHDDHPYHDTGPFPLAFFFSSIKEILVPDRLTVQFILKEPYAPLLSNLAYPTGLVVSPSAVKRYGKDFGRHPSGTGPFRFKEWQSRFKVVLERNDRHWKSPPKTRELIFRPITDINARSVEMFAGGLDIMLEVPPDLTGVFQKETDFRLYRKSGPHLWFLILNLGEGPCRDKRVRQALNYAINKTALIREVLQGMATAANGPVPEAFAWAYNRELSPYPYDPERARWLIREAGYENASLTFYVPESGSGMLSPVAMATAIQADLKAVGLNVKIETFEWNTYLDKVNQGLRGKADMAEMAWMTNDPDVLPYLTLRTAAWPQNGGFNSGYYSNTEVDSLLEAARATTDRQTRATLYRKVQTVVHDDAPWVFVASAAEAAAATSDLKGFQLEPSFLLYLESAYKEPVKAGGLADDE